MQIEKCMKANAITVRPEQTVQQAAALMVENHVGSLPVISNDGKLVGLLTLIEIVHLFMPDFVSLLNQLNFVPDFGILEDRELSTDSETQSVAAVMGEPVCILHSAGLLRAFAEFEYHNVTDLPVVDEDNRLLGIASRVDIGTAFLAAWKQKAREVSPQGASER